MLTGSSHLILPQVPRNALQEDSVSDFKGTEERLTEQITLLAFYEDKYIISFSSVLRDLPHSVWSFKDFRFLPELLDTAHLVPDSLLSLCLQSTAVTLL